MIRPHFQSKETQVNTLADGILYSFGLSDDRMEYNTVSNKSKAHFVKQRNPILSMNEEVHKRRDEEREPVDSFITLLYWLAEHCNYSMIHTIR